LSSVRTNASGYIYYSHFLLKPARFLLFHFDLHRSFATMPKQMKRRERLTPHACALCNKKKIKVRSSTRLCFHISYFFCPSFLLLFFLICFHFLLFLLSIISSFVLFTLLHFSYSFRSSPLLLFFFTLFLFFFFLFSISPFFLFFFTFFYADLFYFIVRVSFLARGP
jgi:hypothetical protein